MRFKEIAIFFLAIILPAFASASDTDFWRFDLDRAAADAIASKNPILLYFTGSDWCHWCQKLDRELFAPSLSRNRLEQLLVPVLIDFPRKRKESPGKVRKNRQLKQAWSVDAFPTIILFDPTTEIELWRHSYISASPQEYLKEIERLLQKLKRERRFTEQSRRPQGNATYWQSPIYAPN